MQKDETIIRLKRVLLSDKINMPNGLLNLLKKDVYSLLSCYFELDYDTLKITVDSNTKGEYDIMITAKAERVKSPKFF
ncbi:MAG: cell division topological specificity factor MinE [Bacillota bacterium]|jgi:septum formation topological specificity factor MinE|nr:cell division topological specificity factor MinE [Bacillota bacterium]HHU43315.1 hypothetical protein [Clostridiales bacterium]